MQSIEETINATLHRLDYKVKSASGIKYDFITGGQFELWTLMNGHRILIEHECDDEQRFTFIKLYDKEINGKAEEHPYFFKKVKNLKDIVYALRAYVSYLHV